MKLIDLHGKRALIRQSQELMGPALVRVFGVFGAFGSFGAVVQARCAALGRRPGLGGARGRSGRNIDVLFAHLALPAPSTALEAVQGEDWRSEFAHRVDPLPRLARAVWLQFTARGAGRIVVIGSAAA